MRMERLANPIDADISDCEIRGVARHDLYGLPWLKSSRRKVPAHERPPSVAAQAGTNGLFRNSSGGRAGWRIPPPPAGKFRRAPPEADASLHAVDAGLPDREAPRADAMPAAVSARRPTIRRGCSHTDTRAKVHIYMKVIVGERWKENPERLEIDRQV
jgi:hypothetical protein